MPILKTLRGEGVGDWPSLADFLREARKRETGALAALSTALTAPPDEQKELTQGEGAAVLLELACDLRVPKGGRVAAARCLLEADAGDAGKLFSGAGDLISDPRLGALARKLVESGLPAALKSGGEPAKVSLGAGAFARSAHSAASAVGQARIKEMLAAAPKGHAGALAALFALGQGELPKDQLEAWKKLLESTCGANRRAPAAAKRLGLAPPWPPNLPDAFAPLLKEAEEKTAGVKSADAAASPPVVQPKATAAPPPAARPGGPPAPIAMSKSEETGQKTMGPAIRRSPFRRAIGTVVEVGRPTTAPPKPMEPLIGRVMPSTPVPEPQRPHVEERDDRVTPKPAPMAGLGPLRSKEMEGIRYDPHGRKIPRSDRWRDDEFEWELPTLPSSELPQPLKAGVAPGPFAQRLQSLFDNRPEAVDRLCAAAEARVAVAGEEAMLRDLSRELGRKRWENARAPREQLERLRNIEQDEKQPGPWRAAARFLLDRLASA
jgi:hypothetical protein